MPPNSQASHVWVILGTAVFFYLICGVGMLLHFMHPDRPDPLSGFFLPLGSGTFLTAIWGY